MLNENTLSQLGYDRNLIKGDKFYDRVLQNNIENQVLASLLGSGEVSIGILKSPNFVSGSAGCKIDFPAGTAEFQTIVAGDYIKIFVQDAIPTSLHINDIWYDSNDDNKSYRAACVGADQITAGEWERVDNPTEWADVLDGDSHKPEDDADVTSANNQGVAWLNESVGSELPTANTAAKCTDANADQTSANTAANIAGQGALATSDDADFNTEVSGAEKPANNATVGGIIGTDIKDEDANIPAQDLIVNFGKYTAGEAITDANAVCIKPGYTDILTSDDSYVYETNGNTNYGTEIQMYIDKVTSNTKQTFVKFSMTNVPLSNKIIRAELRLRRYGFTGTARNILLTRVSGADWAEGTITWNNKPAVTDDVDYVYGSEKTKATGSNPQWMVWDITQLVRHWKTGNVNNYGLKLEADTLSGSLSFDTKEGATESERPVLRIYSVDESDGKIYKTDCSDYLLCRSIIGVAQEGINIDAEGKIQTNGKITNLTAAAGSKVFLSATPGGISAYTTNLNRIIQIGKTLAANNVLLDIPSKDILIEKLYNALTATTAAQRFYVPSDARYAVVNIDGSVNLLKKVFYISREADGLTSYTFTEDGSSPQTVTLNWNIANDYLTITLGAVGAKIKNLYFYT